MRNSTKSRTLTEVRKWNFGCTSPNIAQKIFLSCTITEHMCLGLRMSKKAKSNFSRTKYVFYGKNHFCTHLNRVRFQRLSRP